ncbi:MULTISPECIES: hypothetical protein [Delftia]|uniref:Phage ABA sandwich domain-containing protein n=1 Tax=Delftia deserti TaxID=1651218 RepID=A0ABW5F071_9BURK|nr:hypothetical protein [Delftia acidovorans]EPD36107.1 hypothetical protein HMPREF9701_04926 [Delftia acidovorans CCUG 274B]
MSTEREMLEAAARAMGMHVLAESEPWPSECEGWFFKEVDGQAYLWNLDGPARPWNPRHSKEQSMDLMAALRISVEHNDPYDRHPWVCASVWTDGDSSAQQYLEDVPDESQRADRMRLAILRCAADQAPKEQA